MYGIFPSTLIFFPVIQLKALANKENNSKAFS